jgi:hypothetical protein
MGDRKPKKNSSGNSDAHKAKKLKGLTVQPIADALTDDKAKSKKKK